jgi:hypothetical protein
MRVAANAAKAMGAGLMNRLAMDAAEATGPGLLSGLAMNGAGEQVSDERGRGNSQGDTADFAGAVGAEHNADGLEQGGKAQEGVINAGVVAVSTLVCTQGCRERGIR